MRSLFLIIFSVITLISCGYGSTSSNKFGTKPEKSKTILKVDMRLNAFGVESDDFPSVTASIDFAHNSSECIKTYYNPSFKGSTYHLSSAEVSQVLALLQKADLENLKNRYHVPKTDQPTSTITVYTDSKNYSIEDYGLVGEYPLQKLYSLVYKL